MEVGPTMQSLNTVLADNVRGQQNLLFATREIKDFPFV